MRYERKLTFNKNCLNLINCCINEFNLFETYPSRRVNSIYYDCPNFSCYFESINGIKNRKKKRIRWYDYKNDILIFEEKQKLGELGLKEIIKDNRFSKSNYYTDILNTTKNLSYKIKHPKLVDNIYQPTVGVSYKRKYFATKDLHIRVTLDTDIIYGKFTANQKNSSINFYPQDNSNLIEVKYDSKYEIEANNFIKLISKLTNCIYERHSKYCNAISNFF